MAQLSTLPAADVTNENGLLFISLTTGDNRDRALSLQALINRIRTKKQTLQNKSLDGANCAVPVEALTVSADVKLLLAAANDAAFRDQLGLGTMAVANLVAYPILQTLPKLPSYTVATLPAGTAGATAYVTNLRVLQSGGSLEGSGAGTGGMVVHNGTAWKVAGTNITASA